MPFQVTFPDGYGLVSFVALGLIPLLSFAHGTLTTVLRRDAKVPYPNAYATAQQVKELPDAYRFNCAQRAHAQLLENMPQTMVMLMFAGLGYPRAAAALGAAWLACRVAYGAGYVFSAKPQGQGRLLGGGFWLAQGGIWALCVAYSWQMLY